MMETKKAKIKLVKLLLEIIPHGKQLEEMGLWETIGDLAELADQALNALDEIKSAGVVPDVEYLEVEE